MFYDFWELVILVTNIKFLVRCVQIVLLIISLDMPLFHRNRTDMEIEPICEIGYESFSILFDMKYFPQLNIFV